MRRSRVGYSYTAAEEEEQRFKGHEREMKEDVTQ